MAAFNVKTGYGAKGDGVTDDTAAIEAACTAAIAAGTSSTLVFPFGTYYVKGSNTGTDPIDVQEQSVTAKTEEFPT